MCLRWTPGVIIDDIEKIYFKDSFFTVDLFDCITVSLLSCYSSAQ